MSQNELPLLIPERREMKPEMGLGRSRTFRMAINKIEPKSTDRKDTIQMFKKNNQGKAKKIMRLYIQLKLDSHQSRKLADHHSTIYWSMSKEIY